MTMEATLKWTDGLQFVGRVGDSPAIVMDGGDGGSGPSPMQLVLMGIAGCTAMDVASILEKKRVKMTGFEINISGERADEHPKRFVKVHIEYVVKGTGISPKAVERSIELSETKYCSAMASICAETTSSYQIIEPDA